MSQTDTDDDQSELPGQLRTVTSDMGMHPDMEMNVIGLGIFVILLVIMLPLLPVFVVGWLLAKIFSRQTPE